MSSVSVRQSASRSEENDRQVGERATMESVGCDLLPREQLNGVQQPTQLVDTDCGLGVPSSWKSWSRSNFDSSFPKLLYLKIILRQVL